MSATRITALGLALLAAGCGPRADCRAGRAAGCGELLVQARDAGDLGRALDLIEDASLHRIPADQDGVGVALTLAEGCLFLAQVDRFDRTLARLGAACAAPTDLACRGHREAVASAQALCAADPAAVARRRRAWPANPDLPDPGWCRALVERLRAHRPAGLAREPVAPEHALAAALFEGLAVDVLVPGLSSGDADAAARALGFEATDDAWARRSGGEPALWLLPLVDPGHRPPVEVGRGEGPFAGLRLRFAVLGRPANELESFLDAFDSLVARTGGAPSYASRGGGSASRARLQSDAERLLAAWRAAGVEPGSQAARRIDF